MTTPVVSNQDLVIQLTDSELNYLQSFLDTGDRAGFYLNYFNIAGTSQALVQAKIATFSETFGGIAYLANASLQINFGPLQQYAGIYYLSQRVAQEAIDAVENAVQGGRSGVISGQAMFSAARLAWERGGLVEDGGNGFNQSAQFPGNSLTSTRSGSDQCNALIRLH